MKYFLALIFIFYVASNANSGGEQSEQQRPWKSTIFSSITSKLKKKNRFFEAPHYQEKVPPLNRNTFLALVIFSKAGEDQIPECRGYRGNKCESTERNQKIGRVQLYKSETQVGKKVSFPAIFSFKFSENIAARSNQKTIESDIDDSLPSSELQILDSQCPTCWSHENKGEDKFSIPDSNKKLKISDSFKEMVENPENLSPAFSEDFFSANKNHRPIKKVHITGPFKINYTQLIEGQDPYMTITGLKCDINLVKQQISREGALTISCEKTISPHNLSINLGTHHLHRFDADGDTTAKLKLTETNMDAVSLTCGGNSSITAHGNAGTVYAFNNSKRDLVLRGLSTPRLEAELSSNANIYVKSDYPINSEKTHKIKLVMRKEDHQGNVVTEKLKRGVIIKYYGYKEDCSNTPATGSEPATKSTIGKMQPPQL